MTDERNEAQQEDTELTAPPGMLYGVSIFQMADDSPVVHVSGTPDLGQLQRLLSSALANLQAEIIAEKVVSKLDAEKKRPKIHLPMREGGTL